jgi:hypothetical protein
VTAAPRLTDFGLAVRVSPTPEDSMAPAGTIGYLDPCYTEPAWLGPASDVFSYDVVLLELISGRKVMDVDACPSSIVSWATPLIVAVHGREVLNVRVSAPPLPNASVARVLTVMACCVSERVESRPCMAEVVSELRATLEGAGGWRGPRGMPTVWWRVRAAASWWGGGHVHSKRVRATNKVVECTSSSGALKDPGGSGLPTRSSSAPSTHPQAAAVHSRIRRALCSRI